MISMTARRIGCGLRSWSCCCFWGLHVATALFLTAVLAIQIYFGGSLLNVYGTQLWSAMEDYILLSVPALHPARRNPRTLGATDKMYGAIALWLRRLPGGLLHTECRRVRAVLGRVRVVGLDRRNNRRPSRCPRSASRKYDDRLVLGSIAAGASLGNLIPPGIAFIVYASLTNTSVGQLYAAAIIPSILMTVLFMLTIAAAGILRPDLRGRARAAGAVAREASMRLADLTGPLVVFVIIMGSVYTGWATVTESAALSVIAALGIAVANRTLSIRMLHDAFVATANLTAITMLILAVAFYLNFALGSLKITETLGGFVATLGSSTHGPDVDPGGLLLPARHLLRDAADDGRHRADHLPDRDRDRHRPDLVLACSWCCSANCRCSRRRSA